MSCSQASVPEFDDGATSIIIKKKTTVKLELGSCYLIRLSDSSLRESDFSSNWNRGILPRHRTMKVELIKKVGNAFMVDGIGCDESTCKDTDVCWSGWIQSGDFEVIEKL